jgi:hypothetical protein
MKFLNQNYSTYVIQAGAKSKKPREFCGNDIAYYHFLKFVFCTLQYGPYTEIE